MIRRFFARLIPGKASSKPLIYGPDAHPIRRTHISRGANDVIRKLQQAGFKAFIVGGAVRDLLLGITPKDFDLATDATPEQVKPLFRRAFIIGRRFRLVHVLAGPETIEVATFRSLQTGDDAGATTSAIQPGGSFSFSFSFFSKRSFYKGTKRINA